MKEVEHKVVCLASLAVDLGLCILHYLGMKRPDNQRVGSGDTAADSLIVQVHMALVE